MTTTTIKSSLLFVVCLVFTVNLSAQQVLTTSELAGTYVVGHNFGGSSITLQADGTYSQDSGACTMATKESGKYFLSDDTCSLYDFENIRAFNSPTNQKRLTFSNPEARKELEKVKLF